MSRLHSAAGVRVEPVARHEPERAEVDSEGDAMTACPHHPAVDTSHEPCPECAWDEVRDRAFPAVADPNADTVVDEESQ